MRSFVSFVALCFAALPRILIDPKLIALCCCLNFISWIDRVKVLSFTIYDLDRAGQEV